MRVGYDARMAIGRYRGMGRYLRQLIQGREHEFLGFCASGERDESLNLISSGYKFFPLWEQISLPSLIRKHEIELFLAPYNTAPLRMSRRVKVALIIHDLIYQEKLPPSASRYQNFGRAYRKFIVPRVLHRADMIITVSHYTKMQLANRYRIPGEMIRVIPNSLKAAWFTHSSDVFPRRDYILMVSGEAPSKNLERALHAYALYRRTTSANPLRLKVAGVKPEFHRGFTALSGRLEIAPHVDFLGYLSDDEMYRVHHAAKIFFMPSLFEGFGVPVLEAMASGSPVLASNTTALPEVGGEAACYCNPKSAEDMAAGLCKLTEEPELRARMSIAGRQQARKFHPTAVHPLIQQFWEDSGMRTVEGVIG